MPETHPSHARTHETDSVKALSDLTTDIVDVIKGYETMRERAEPDLLSAVERLHALHAAHCTALMNHLAAMGGNPGDTGSVMGAVHTAVATARDWFGALDGAALDGILDGERRLIESYTTALSVAHEDRGVVALLEEQRAALRSEIVALRAD